jgi:putative aldouronate transport system permease protein
VNSNKMKKNKPNIMRLKDNIQLWVLALPAVILTLLFAYFPMFGIILPFKDFKVNLGFFGSPWADPIYRNFRLLFITPVAGRIIRNTVVMNLLFIAFGTFCSIAFALILFEVKKAIHIKAYQTFSILPYFISWVAVSYIAFILLDTNKGILNQIIRAFGGENISWYMEPSYWPVILIIVSIWKGTGINCIIYYASLMGIDTELFESASIDGATKIQQIRYISLPHLRPLALLLLIMSFGGIFSGDFGLFYNVTRNVSALYPTTDIINTYVFRVLMVNGDVAVSSATGLLQSFVDLSCS